MRPLACQQLVEMVTDHLESALSARDEARVHRHLTACANCAVYIDQIRRLIGLSGRLIDAPPPGRRSPTQQTGASADAPVPEEMLRRLMSEFVRRAQG